MKEPEYALIVAGGKGTRMHSHTPKQFLELLGKPILIRTLEAFYRYSKDIPVILVLPEHDIPAWYAMAGRYDFPGSPTVVAGGNSRFQSVRRGLAEIDGHGLVAIHDGVRPLVHEDTIATSFRLAGKHKAAVAAVLLKDSIREVASAPGGDLAAWDQPTTARARAAFRLIQTPQTFSLDLIRKAYSLPEDPALTDDASVAERAGYPITLFEGSYQNIKITTMEDLPLAETFLKAAGRL